MISLTKSIQITPFICFTLETYLISLSHASVLQYLWSFSLKFKSQNSDIKIICKVDNNFDRNNDINIFFYIHMSQPWFCAILGFDPLLFSIIERWSGWVLKIDRVENCVTKRTITSKSTNIIRFFKYSYYNRTTYFVNWTIVSYSYEDNNQVEIRSTQLICSSYKCLGEIGTNLFFSLNIAWIFPLKIWRVELKLLWEILCCFCYFSVG